MIIVSRKILREFWKKHPEVENALKLWEIKVKEADWQNLNDIKSYFADADAIGDERVVFNIRGNNYRIVTIVKIRNHRVYVRWIGTHAEYDKINALKV